MIFFRVKIQKELFARGYDDDDDGDDDGGWLVAWWFVLLLLLCINEPRPACKFNDMKLFQSALLRGARIDS